MVLCWMMMPRSGGRKVSDALRIVTEIFERNLAAWEEDDATFTGRGKGTKVKKKTKMKSKTKSGAKRQTQAASR